MKVYDLCWREGSARHGRYQRPACGRRVLTPLGKAARREPKQANVDQGRLGFAMIEQPGKAHQVRVESHG